MAAILFTEETIKKAAQGDHEALTKLVEQLQNRIYNFCLKYHGDHHLAADITQKTFITMCSKIGGLKNHSQFKSWIYSIAANYCHDERRKASRFQSIFSSNVGDGNREEAILTVEPESDEMPELSFQKEELAAILKKALGCLSEEQRVVVIMKEYEGLKFSEIAEILKISESTAKSRLYYGLNQLKKILRQWNINKETVYYGV